eukprot:2956637-Rhodomonas_salina.1
MPGTDIAYGTSIGGAVGQCRKLRVLDLRWNQVPAYTCPTPCPVLKGYLPIFPATQTQRITPTNVQVLMGRDASYEMAYVLCDVQY